MKLSFAAPLTLTAVLIAALTAGCAVAQSSSIAPGRWTHRSDYTLNNQTVPPAGGGECLSAAAAKDLRATIAARLQRDVVACKITQWSQTGGTLNVGVACDNGQGAATGQVSGPVSADSYELKGVLKGRNEVAGPFTIGVRWSGKRVGAC